MSLGVSVLLAIPESRSDSAFADQRVIVKALDSRLRGNDEYMS